MKLKDENFPRQGYLAGSRAEVVFEYNTSRPYGAEVIRDDHEEPFITILRLDDGRVVLATECQWRPL